MQSEISNLFKFLILYSTAGSKAPIEILHKYLIRNEEYEKFIETVHEALPNDPFGDDTWATDFLKTIKNKEDKEKFGQMIASFDALRTFIRENKIYQKLICSYPDPEMDSKIVERLISGSVTNNQTN